MSNPLISEIVEQPSDPLGGSSGEKRRFTVQFIGKSNNAEFPYTIANEVVATYLGIALGINLPSVLTHTLADNTFVLIQEVNRDPSLQQSPPATSRVLAEFVASHPWEIHGAIVFDLFVANNDRAFGPERRNLMLDTDGQLLLYDQGNACYYRHRPVAKIEGGIQRLNAVEADLTALFDMDHKENHYREFLTDWSLVEQWCDRIRSLPEYVIESAANRIPKQLSVPTMEERHRLIEFLVRRREYLFEHINRFKVAFPGLPSRERT